MADASHDGNGDLTLREAELQLTAEQEWRSGHLREHELLAGAHRERHEAEQLAVSKAETSQQKAIDAALSAVDQAGDTQRLLVKNSLEDHHREHLTHEASHAREHTLVGDALSKAESAMDKRLEGIVQLFAERDKSYGERFEGVLRAITQIEKGEVKQEGRSLGQTATVAIIVTAITVVGGVLGIVISLANVAARLP